MAQRTCRDHDENVAAPSMSTTAKNRHILPSLRLINVFVPNLLALNRCFPQSIEGLRKLTTKQVVHAFVHLEVGSSADEFQEPRNGCGWTRTRKMCLFFYFLDHVPQWTDVVLR